MKFLYKIWINGLRQFWSKIRWYRQSKIISENVQVVNDNNLSSILKDVYTHFEWVADGASQLFDSIRPAPALYNEYLNCITSNSKIKDDCDGFHAIIYHILNNSGYNVALLTMVTKPLKNSHTVVVVYDSTNNSYRIIDYLHISKPYSTIEEYISKYTDEVVDWGLDRYDYKKVSISI